MNVLPPRTQTQAHIAFFFWLAGLAIFLPISIALSSILYFPLLTLFVVFGTWALRLWPPEWTVLEKAFIAFWLVSLLSGLLGVAPRHSMVRLGKDLYFAILVLVCAYMGARGNGSRLGTFFMMSAIASAVFGILQYCIGVEQTDAHRGVFLHLPAWTAHFPRPVLDTLSIVNGRVKGTRAHPITYAEGLLFPLAYTLAQIKENRSRDWWKWPLAQAVIVVALLISLSRGSWIATVCMGVASVVIDGDLKLLKRLGLLYFPIGLLFFMPVFRNRARSIFDRAYQPNAERIEMWHVGRRIVRDYPFLGVGPGNIPLVSSKYQSEERRREGPWGHLHDTYINVAAERGLIGLIVFVVFIGVLTRQLWQGYRWANSQEDSQRRVLILAALFSVVGWLVAGITETIYHDSNILMMFYFVMGLGIGARWELLQNFNGVNSAEKSPGSTNLHSAPCT